MGHRRQNRTWTSHEGEAKLPAEADVDIHNQRSVSPLKPRLSAVGAADSHGGGW
jgi:hypothetical protein